MGRWEGREKDEKERCNKSNDGTRVIMRKVGSKMIKDEESGIKDDKRSIPEVRPKDQSSHRDNFTNHLVIFA